MQVKRNGEKKGERKELTLETMRKSKERKRKSRTEINRDAGLKRKKRRKSEIQDSSICN